MWGGQRLACSVACADTHRDDTVTTSLLAITAGMLVSVSKVLSQQSAEERWPWLKLKCYRLQEKQFVHDPATMLTDTLVQR